MKLSNQDQKTKKKICSIDGCCGIHKGYGYCNKHYQRFKNNGDPHLVLSKKNKFNDKCTQEGCNNKFLAKGLCGKHYQRLSVHGNASYEPFLEKCIINNCDKKHQAQGYCSSHYRRYRLYGDPLRIKMHREYKTALEYYEDNVDKNTQTGCWEWKGSKRKGYGWLSVKYETVSAHRFAYMHFIGPIPEGMFVCHHCDNRGCCRPDHLFVGTHADNMQDCIKKNRHRWRHKNGKVQDND